VRNAFVKVHKQFSVFSFRFSVRCQSLCAESVEHFSYFIYDFIQLEAAFVIDQPKFFGNDSLSIQFCERAVRHREELTKLAKMLSCLALGNIRGDRNSRTLHLTRQAIQLTFRK